MRSSSALGPAVAGSWYPANRYELGALVDRLLDDAAKREPAAAEGATAALIAPHAGFEYSGRVAASAFRNLRGRRFTRTLVIGPSHYFGFRGAAVPSEAAVYRTPLGDAPIDRESVLALSDVPGFRADDRVFEPEHALEAELPFLQRVLGSDVAIVPVLMGGGAAPDDAALVATAVGPLLDANTLVVVSSDFTHYGRRFGYVPFTDDVPRRIRELDRGAIDAIEAGDAGAFARYVEATGATICGRRAIDVLLRLPFAGGGARLVAYDASGRMTGDWDHSVSYASIAMPTAGVAR